MHQSYIHKKRGRRSLVHHITVHRNELMAFIPLFWHIIIHLPVLGSSGGDVPAFALVLFWAPFYLVAYGLLAGGEYWLRRRSVSVSTPST